MWLVARALALTLGAGALACVLVMPPLQVVYTPGGVTLDVQTMGEYVTAVSRIRVRDDRAAVIWEVRARERVPQIGTVRLRCGSNSVFVPEYPEYEVIAPKSPTFVLHAKATYIVQVWDPHLLLPHSVSVVLKNCA